jgi:hypothetical protein
VVVGTSGWWLAANAVLLCMDAYGACTTSLTVGCFLVLHVYVYGICPVAAAAALLCSEGARLGLQEGQQLGLQKGYEIGEGEQRTGQGLAAAAAAAAAAAVQAAAAAMCQAALQQNACEAAHCQQRVAQQHRSMTAAAVAPA